MSYKIKISLILLISIIFVLVSKILLTPESFGFCRKGDLSCINNYISINHMFLNPSINITQIVYTFSIPIIILSFLFLFFQENIFKVWLKFATLFVSISIIAIILMAVETSGTLIFINERMSSIFLATIFFFMSLALIITKSFRPAWRLWIVLPLAFILSAIGLLIFAIAL